MNHSHQQLRTFLSEHIEGSEPFWQDCLAAWQPFTAKRKELLTAAGDREQYLYFVISGIQRAYYLSDQAKEATLIFTYAPSLSGIADAFLSQQPSRYYLETLTSSTFLRIPYEIFMQQCQQYEQMNDLAFKLAAMALDGVLFRLAELQTLSAEAKFKSLMARSPHLLNLIPHKYLASYLGIDPTTFSKLLGRIRI